MIRRPPRSTQSRSSAASYVYKRQRFERLCWRLPAVAGGEGREQACGDAGSDQGVAVGGGVDGLGEQGGAGIFEQEPAGACFQRGVDVLVEIEGGDDDDRQRIVDVGTGKLAGRFDAVDVG